MNDPFYAFYGTTAEQEGGYRMAAREYAKGSYTPMTGRWFGNRQKKAGQVKTPNSSSILSTVSFAVTVRCARSSREREDSRDAAGRITRYYGANQDITRTRQKKKGVEDQLLQAQKMEAIGTFSAGIAHDFKNILTAIEGFANLGIKHVQDDSKVKRYLDRICRAVERGKDTRRADPHIQLQG